MMIAIPLGYFVSIFLICAGLLGGMEALANRPEDATNGEFLIRVALSSWPLIAGTALLLLIQIAKQIEELRLVASYVPATESEPQKKKTPRKKKTEEENTNYFGHVTAGVPPVAPESKPAPVVPTPPAPAPAQPSAVSTTGNPAIHGSILPVAIKKEPRSTAPVPITTTHTPLYPNSPIPGGGRVPQDPASAPAPGGDLPPATPASEKEGKPLSFFKID